MQLPWARALGADMVIAVDLGSDLIGWRSGSSSTAEGAPNDGSGGNGGNGASGGFAGLSERLYSMLGTGSRSNTPSILTVVNRSLSIMQVHITRSRLAGEPPDVLITPELGYLGVMDYHRAAEAIRIGREAAEHAVPMIRRQLKHHA